VTAKEAALKLLGVGLAQPMRDVRVDGNRWHVGDQTGHAQWVALNDGVIAAIATLGDAELSVTPWPPERGRTAR
jgi:phosphopantetheinyl transferase